MGAASASFHRHSGGGGCSQTHGMRWRAEACPRLWRPSTHTHSPASTSYTLANASPDVPMDMAAPPARSSRALGGKSGGGGQDGHAGPEGGGGEGEDARGGSWGLGMPSSGSPLRRSGHRSASSMPMIAVALASNAASSPCHNPPCHSELTGGGAGGRRVLQRACSSCASEPLRIGKASVRDGISAELRCSSR